MFVLTSSDLASVKQKAKSLEIMRIYYANTVLMYCMYTMYLSLYIYIYIQFFRIFHNWGCEVFGWYDLKKKRMNHHLWSKFSQVVMSGFAYPILADSVWGDGRLSASFTILGSLPDTLMKYRSLFFFIWYHTIELQYCICFTIYYTVYFIYIYILVLMTVFWYAEATTVTVWQTMRPIDSCFREGPLNSKQLGPGCNTAVSRACFETMQHEHTHNHDYSHMYCNMKRTHIYYDITNTSI